ncbi:MAG TPA: EAL domain-containing protein [Kofleriaceae bacterium]
MKRRLEYNDKEALRAYWTFFAPYRAAIAEDVKRSLSALDCAPALLGARDDLDEWRLEHVAINSDAWAPYLERLRSRGERYARANVPFAAWFKLATLTRARNREVLDANAPDASADIAHGANLVFDIELETLGAAYFETKEEDARRAFEHLHSAQRLDAIGRLASGIAHDFNNVLAIVQTCAGMLEEDLDAADPRRRDATEIRTAADRGAQLARQLLAMSRRDTAAPKPVNIDELVAGFAPSLRRLVGSGVTLDVQRADVPPVLADFGQLEQVLMNLVANARDAMEGRGRVTIETAGEELDTEAAALHRLAAGRYAVLAVSDNGPGIPPDVLARIFEPFFTTKDVGKGTGLGLAIAQSIVAKHSGSIEVYSELGHGTTFRIRIPALHDAPAAPPPRDEVVARSIDGTTVLFVDDQPELRQLGTRVLAGAGCTVLAAATAAEARERCVSHDGDIDVLVLDVALRDGRGDLLVPELRELRPTMKVILMSGFPSAALGPTGDAPARMLAKPFTPGQLRDAIGAVTSERAPRCSDPSLLPRVLIVDDDADLRKMLTRLLRRAAFDVVEVDSGRAALAELAAKRFDVVLSDIHMPDGDGLELLRSVRRIDLDIPVLLMSGKPDVATAATALEFGAFRYLTKPLEVEAVERIVRQAARARALARIRREAVQLAGGDSGAADLAGLEVRFEHALEHLWMDFQPIVDARTSELYGVEALVRSAEPSIPNPGALLETAEQLRRLPTLGRRIRNLSGQALFARTDIPMLFVNLHPSDLLDVHLIDGDAPLTRIASRVVLEVTERESLVASPLLVERVRRLRELGFRLAIDDIGAGYSGLTSFADLMPEIVKIDMSLVRSIHSSAVKQRTVAALCTLCHETGTLVVGEGVETTAERDCLVELGCDLLQGYLIARPARELPPRPGVAR